MADATGADVSSTATTAGDDEGTDESATRRLRASPPMPRWRTPRRRLTDRGGRAEPKTERAAIRDGRLRLPVRPGRTAHVRDHVVRTRHWRNSTATRRPRSTSKARLTFEGETVEPVGVRYKGSIGAFLGCTERAEPVRPERRQDLHEAVDEGEDQLGRPEHRVLRGAHRAAALAEPRPVDDARAARLLVVSRDGCARARVRPTPAWSSTVSTSGCSRSTEETRRAIHPRELRRRHAATSTRRCGRSPSAAFRRPRTALIAGLETNEDEDPNADIMTGFASELAAAAPGRRTRRDRQVERRRHCWCARSSSTARSATRRPAALVLLRRPCAPHNFYWYEDPTERDRDVDPVGSRQRVRQPVRRRRHRHPSP